MKLFGLLPEGDLQHLSQGFQDEHQELDDLNFVIVGATGFLGSWLATYLTYLQEIGLFKGTLTFVVREPRKLAELLKNHKSGPCEVVSIDGMTETSFLHLSQHSRVVVVYAATSTALTGKIGLSVNSKVTDLPEDILKSLPNSHITFVHLSSGGVYSPSARSLKAIPENYDIQSSSSDLYIQNKLDLERWTRSKATPSNFVARNPRLFSFYGPGLQIDRHFAIGEFVKQGMNGLPVELKGNARNLRSYLYPTDTINQILDQCKMADPLHRQIGSNCSRSLLNVSQIVAHEYGVQLEVSEVHTQPVNNYVPQDVPSTPEVDFEFGISQWKRWLEIFS